MLIELGKVISVEHDGLWVETVNSSACGQCKAKSGCGQKLLTDYGRSSSVIKALFVTEQRNHIWKVGDDVEIGINENTLVKSAFLAYILPLLTMVICVITIDAFFESDVLSVIGAMVGLSLGGMVVSQVLSQSHVNAKKESNKYQYHAVVIQDS